MALIIDGYNLLHVTDVTGRGPATFQASREALLEFLARLISDRDRPVTTIVFDAADAPPGLPRVYQYRQMTIRFASEYPDADTLIEKLVAQHSAPRRLTVVSSDHRVQRAAKRRRARCVDSDAWIAEVQRKRQARSARQPPVSDKPAVPPSPSDVDYWIQKFTVGLPREEPRQAAAPPPEVSADDPFPPGYGEDLLDEDGNLP